MIKIHAHLHTHTCYSRKDGLNYPKTLLKEAKRLGQTAMAITDHGSLGGIIRFYKDAISLGIKPILGMEAYHCDSVDSKGRAFHIVLLAKDQIGWENLIKLNNEAHDDDHFYYTMRVTWEMLERHSQGLICLTACVKGMFQWEALQHQKTGGEKGNPFDVALKLYKIFGQDLYIETMYHGDPEQFEILKFQKEFCEQYGFKAVWTNDVHYATKEDSENHTMLMCLQYKKAWAERKDVAYVPEVYIKDEPIIPDGFEDFINSAVQNQLEIIEKCNLELELGKPSLPDLGKKDEIYQIAKDGFERIYGDLSPQKKKYYLDRFEYEWSVIETKQFYDYLWIVHWYTEEARKVMRVGVARGSSAGSLFCQCAGITDDKLDPIKYGLIFERFISPDRVSFPDVDNDFEDKTRVAQMIAERFGDVATVCSYSTYKPKMAFQDIGKLFGMTHDEVCQYTTASNVFKDDSGEWVFAHKDIKGMPAPMLDRPDIMKYALGVSESMKNTGTHAAGVVLVTRPIPLYRDNQTQWDKDDIEEYGLVKFDVLGLATLGIIQGTIDNAGIQEPNWTYDDPDVFALFNNGMVKGIFQFGRTAKLCSEIGIHSINDVAAVTAMNRPGPLLTGTPEKYRNNRKNLELIKTKFPQGQECIIPILEDTNYTLIYQEQISAICRAIGFPPSDAEAMQKAIAKKKDTMYKLRDQFYERFKTLGASVQSTDKLWKAIEGFAGYAFNRAHAMSYAFIAYQTAWLKKYHPVDFMIEFMNHDGFDARECRRLGIPVLAPHVSHSGYGFKKITHEGREMIIAGLSTIKGIGAAKAKSIIDGQPYSDVEDFEKRTRGIGPALIMALDQVQAFRPEL